MAPGKPSGAAVLRGKESPNYKHGGARRLRHTKAYQTWEAMKRRCENPGCAEYPRYGGRGIKVCGYWAHFLNFLADMGEPPPKHSLDRIDNNGDYTKDNCRWATKKQQARNRRSNVLVSYLGHTKTVTEWAEEFEIKPATIFARIRKGWPTEKLFVKPFDGVVRHMETSK